jgi:hypothetical protein
MFKWLKAKRDSNTGSAPKTGHSNNFRRVVSISNDVVIVNGKRLEHGSKEEKEALDSVGVIMNGVGETMDGVGKTMESVGDMFKKMKW